MKDVFALHIFTPFPFLVLLWVGDAGWILPLILIIYVSDPEMRKNKVFLPAWGIAFFILYLLVYALFSSFLLFELAKESQESYEYFEEYYKKKEQELLEAKQVPSPPKEIKSPRESAQ